MNTPCEHVYSKSMHQPYPRHCIKCHKIEDAAPTVGDELKKHFISLGWTPPQASEQGVERLIDWAWTILANAGGGDWEKESKDWQDAVKKWRDEYHKHLSQRTSERRLRNQIEGARHCIRRELYAQADLILSDIVSQHPTAQVSEPWTVAKLASFIDRDGRLDDKRLLQEINTNITEAYDLGWRESIVE